MSVGNTSLVPRPMCEDKKGLVMLCTFSCMCWVSVLCEWSTFLTRYIQTCAAGSCWRWLIISGNFLLSHDQGQVLGDPSSSLSRGYSLSRVKEFNYCRVIDNSWTQFVYLKLNLLTQHMQLILLGFTRPFSVFNAREFWCEATRYQEKIIGYNMVPYTMLAPASQEIRKFKSWQKFNC